MKCCLPCVIGVNKSRSYLFVKVVFAEKIAFVFEYEIIF